MYPAYLGLARSGELGARAEAARDLLSPCRLCPRQCGVDRLGSEIGHCRTGRLADVASAGPHFGEERPLVGSGGSGTIFFAGCNLDCVFCQNSDISHGPVRGETTAAQLAQTMLSLQRQGCHNINLVTPTHVMPQILEALVLAAEAGLRVPLVWNCGGYESSEALRLLDGIVDIYMPDVKYADACVAERLSGVRDYPTHMKAALAEMHRQVGDLVLDKRGIATRGLLVRHLVLPNGLAGTAEIAAFVASLSVDTYVNVMDQYRPCYRAFDVPQIARRITRAEYDAAVSAARDAGLTRLDH